MQAAYADKGRGDRGVVPPQRRLVDLGGVLVSPHGLLEVALALAYPPDVVQDLGHLGVVRLIVRPRGQVVRLVEVRDGLVKLGDMNVSRVAKGGMMRT